MRIETIDVDPQRASRPVKMLFFAKVVPRGAFFQAKMPADFVKDC